MKSDVIRDVESAEFLVGVFRRHFGEQLTAIMANKSDVNNFFDQGEHALKIYASMHESIRQKLCGELKKLSDLPQSAFVVLQGGESETRYCSDTELIFRQESYFQYLFGVREPDCFGAVDVANGKSYLFVPKLPESYAIWMGSIPGLDYFKQRYGVDEVFYIEDMSETLKKMDAQVILTLHGLNSDSGKTTREAVFEGINSFQVNNSILHPILSECRVVKSPEEINILRYVNEVSSGAHREVMRKIRPNMKEYQVESIFQHYCKFQGGARHMAYTCICGSGHNASVLHYGHAAAPNDKTMNDGDMCLFDMGSEYYCYCSDITCSFPVNGRFTEDQKIIYQAVLDASRAVMAAVKPDVSWVDMHHIANRVQLEALKKNGLLKGDVEEMMKANLGSVFMPHGLGHFLGLDTHDVGGYPSDGPPRPEEVGAKSLRTARKLKEGMVLTIEPGLYFINFLLDEALKKPEHAKFLVVDEIERFRGFGGVRIEDDIVITSDGMELLTIVPRTVEEIETLMEEGRKEPSHFPQEKFLEK